MRCSGSASMPPLPALLRSASEAAGQAAAALLPCGAADEPAPRLAAICRVCCPAGARRSSNGAAQQGTAHARRDAQIGLSAAAAHSVLPAALPDHIGARPAAGPPALLAQPPRNGRLLLCSRRRRSAAQAAAVGSSSRCRRPTRRRRRRRQPAAGRHRHPLLPRGAAGRAAASGAHQPVQGERRWGSSRRGASAGSSALTRR